MEGHGDSRKGRWNVSKPYVAKSLAAAQREVRRLRKLVDRLRKISDAEFDNTKALAMLAADGPAFDNPLHVVAAKKIRDTILRLRCRLNPDGSFIK